MKKLLTICLMLLGAVAQAQNFAITATTEAAIRKNIVKGNAANYGFGMINDTLKLVGLTTRNVIFTGSTSKTDIGLGNVDNTSDLNKPVSTATQTALNLKQNQLNGTGFVKATGTTISYDNSTYLSTSSASSTYLPISNPTATGILTAPTIANSLGATFATTSGNVGIGTTSPAAKLHVYSTAAFNRMQVENTGNFQNGLRLNRTGGDYATDWEIYTPSNSTALNFFNGSNRMTMFANGRVGINTTTDAGFLLDVNGTTRLNGNVSIGTVSNARTLSVQTTSNDVNIEGINSRTTGNNYAITGNSNGIGAGLNMGGFFQASGATSNHGLRIFNVAATANNYSLYSDSPAQSYFQGSVGIGTGTPNASSILDITSTTKGVLLPRMTTTEISAIASPADGLTVYNTTLKVICFYDSSAAVWKKVSHSNM